MDSREDAICDLFTELQEIKENNKKIASRLEAFLNNEQIMLDEFKDMIDQLRNFSSQAQSHYQ